MLLKLLWDIQKNILNKNDYKSITSHISNLNLPLSIKKLFKSKDINKIVSFMLKDKKNKSNKINLVLLNKIGSATINREFNKQSLKFFFKEYLTN